MTAPRKLFIKTYGCQMNVYDSERMAEALTGYARTERLEEADLILLNTCHIREKAAEKVYSELGRFRGLKDARPDLKIGVAGCVAQAEGEEIMRRQPLVDLVVGPQSYHRLPELEARARGGAKALDTDFPAEDKFDHLAAVTNFVIVPLTFLSGTFYDIKVLVEPFQTAAYFDPIFYLIDGFRAGFIGVSNSDLMTGVIASGIFTFLSCLWVWWLFRTGYKLKA